MTNVQIELHTEELQQIISGPAYAAVRAHFQAASVQHPHVGVSMEELGKQYIQDSAIKSVFDTFEAFAKGTSETDALTESITLEAETMDDDVLSTLDQ